MQRQDVVLLVEFVEHVPPFWQGGLQADCMEAEDTSVPAHNTPGDLLFRARILNLAVTCNQACCWTSCNEIRAKTLQNHSLRCHTRLFKGDFTSCHSCNKKGSHWRGMPSKAQLYVYSNLLDYASASTEVVCSIAG